MNDKVIAVNRKVRHDYEILETYEAGIVLQGWEVKSLRAGKAQLADCYVVFRSGEAWLLNSVISPLSTASTHIQPESDRSRKLLLHRRQIESLRGHTERKGCTVVAMSLYWHNNRVKVKIALVKGKKSHDKRQSLKDRDWQRQKSQLFKKNHR